MDMNRTGSLIEQMRKERKMTQAELADAVGVSKQAVSNWERGKRFPDVALIEDLSRELGVSPAELIRGQRFSESNMSDPETTQLVLEALRVQKKELNRRWLLIALMLVALTAMICLAARYAFFMDRLWLMNFSFLGTALPTAMAIAFGCAIAYFSADRESFYKSSLTAMTIWIVCESVSAIGMSHETGAIDLVVTAARAAWYVMFGLAGAWMTYIVVQLVKKKKSKRISK